MVKDNSPIVTADTVDNTDENVFNNQIQNVIVNRDGKVIDTTNYRNPVIKQMESN